MATARLSPEQTAEAVTRRRFDQRGNALAVGQALPPEASGVALVIQELGPGPITLTLRRGLGIEVGAEWATETKGETRTPMGASEGYGSVTGTSYGKTEMTLSVDPAHLRPGDLTVVGTVPPSSSNLILALFEALQARARSCLVQVGPLVRRGLLRQVRVVPGRGASVDLGGSRVGATFGYTLGLTWDWSGLGAPVATPEQPPSGADLAGQLGAADSGFGFALAEADDAFDPDALTALSGAIGRVRGQVSQLRRTVAQIGSLAAAPARLARDALAAARSLGNVINDLETQLGDTRDAYLAVGKAAESTATALGPRASATAKAARAKGAIREANQAAMEAVLALFDGLARRQGRRVAVRPGESLADVARRALGDAERWPEIASKNGLAGQVVPDGVREVEL
jgi:hypothetical protein